MRYLFIFTLIFLKYANCKFDIPQFMLDLYDVRANKIGESRPKDPYLGMTIRCLFAQNVSQSASPNRFLYRFKLTYKDKFTVIDRVELRVFRTWPAVKRKVENKFILAVLNVVTGAFNVSSSIIINSKGYAWLSFDLTNQLRWLYFKLKKRTRDTFNNTEVNIEIKMEPSINYQSVRFETNASNTMGALLVFYSKEESKTSNKFELQNIILRSEKKLPPSHSKFFNIDSSKKKVRLEREIKSFSKGGCRKKNMHIKFSDYLELRDIMIPKKANFYRCVGSCAMPFGKDSKIKKSSRAYFQELISKRGSGNYRAMKLPTCSPATLKSMSYIRLESSQAISKTWVDAIVKECWCP